MNSHISEPQSAASSKHHLPWVDAARFTAIFLVVCCHCCDPFNLSPNAATDPDFGFFGAFYGSMVRPCVPLFAMMTGLLLLPVRNVTMEGFYKKRLLRVLVPFLIWSLLYNLFPWVVGLFGGDASVVTLFFPYAGAYGLEPSLTFASAIKNIALIPFNFSVYAVHMWYIYMLIGLYLFMPVISSWLDKCSKRSLEVYLMLWGVTLFFPYVYQFLSTYFWGTCSWNSFGMLYYFAGFNGYLLLGYYLKKYNRMTLGKTLLVAIPLFLIGYVATFTGFRHMIGNPDSTEPMIELFWTYCSPNVVLMTIAFFILLQKVRIPSDRFLRWLNKVSLYGLGIYMCHYFFVGIGYVAAQKLGVPVALQIPVAAVLVMTLSWILTASAFRAFPKVAKWVLG